MRNYMPAEHRSLIAAVEAMPNIRTMATKQNYNAVLDAMAEFRSVHYGWNPVFVEPTK
jgi:indoleamine 2,3-dioxygenase